MSIYVNSYKTTKNEIPNNKYKLKNIKTFTKEKSANGPQHWGDLKEEWAACKIGQIQSPIDLSTNGVEVIPKLGGLKYWNYKPQHATVSNRGHDVAVSTNVF